MQVSIVNRSKLNPEFRLDAEYYKPEALSIEKKIMSKPHWISGKVFDVYSGPFGSTVTTDKYDHSTNLRYIRGKDVLDFFIDDADPIYIQENLFTQLSQHHLKPQDILVTVVGMNFGKSALIFPNDCPSIFSCKSSLIRNVKVNPFFLTAYLSCRYGYALVRRGQRGAAQPGINLFDLRNIPIPIFSDEFQKEIEKLIIQSREIKEKSKMFFSQAENLLLQELGLLGWKAEHVRTFVRSYSDSVRLGRMDAEHLQPKYEQLREIIKNYKGGYCKLSAIAHNSKLVIDPRNQPDKVIQYIELADIKQNLGLITSSTLLKGKEAPSRAKMILKSGDVIASSVEGSLDKVALVQEEFDGAIGSTGFFVLHPCSVESGYLLALVKSIIVREQMHREASGTILAAVPSKSLRNIIVPDIESSKRNEIALLVRQAHSSIYKSNELLEKAKQAIEIAVDEGEEQAISYFK